MQLKRFLLRAGKKPGLENRYNALSHCVETINNQTIVRYSPLEIEIPSKEFVEKARNFNSFAIKQEMTVFPKLNMNPKFVAAAKAWQI